MNEEGSERGRKLRVGVFVLIGVAAFLGMIYALGARARLFEPRITVHAEFTEVGGLEDAGCQTLAIEPHKEMQILCDPEVLVKMFARREQSHGRSLLGGAARKWDTVQENFTRRRIDETREQLQKRCFPCAVGSYESHAVARLQINGEISDRPDPAIGLRQAAYA